MAKIAGYGGTISFGGVEVEVDEWEADFVDDTPRVSSPLDVAMVVLACKPPYVFRPRRLVGWFFPERS